MPSKKAATKKKPIKTAATAPAAATDNSSEPRRITPESYVSRIRRVRAARKLARTKLPGSFIILYRSIRMLASHWEIFGGILVIYAVINLLLIGGFSSSDTFEQTKENLSDVFTGNFSQLNTGLALLGFLITSGTTVASGGVSAYQSVVLLVVSLAVIWALRQLYANNKVRIRDTFYQSTYPMVQVILTLLVVCLQLVPGVLGAALFTSLVLNGVLIELWQQILVGVVFALALFWTIYMLTASVFAVYIATLPEMTPLKALRSARDIVRHRRGTVLLKLLYLPFSLLIIAVLIMVPLTVFTTTAATVVYFIMSMISVPVIHSYMYSLYRALIAE